jgi:hypothetical protein
MSRELPKADGTELARLQSECSCLQAQLDAESNELL